MDLVPPEALLAGLPDPMPDLAQKLRVLVKRAEPEAIEKVRPGWRVIGYDLPLDRRRTAFFAWIWAQPEHVHLGFPQGVHLSDPARLLQGAGITKLARWVTLSSVDDLRTEEFEALVHAAAAFASIPKAARVAGVTSVVRSSR
jgi:hypothetical protein